MFKKIVSTSVISAFVVTMPGASFYQAWGQGGAAGMKSAAIGRVQAARMIKIPTLPGVGVQKNLDFQRRFLKSVAASGFIPKQATSLARKSSLFPAAAQNLREAVEAGNENSSLAKDQNVSPTEVKESAGKIFERVHSEATALVVQLQRASHLKSMDAAADARRKFALKHPANSGSAGVKTKAVRLLAASQAKGKSSERGAVRFDWMLAILLILFLGPIGILIVILWHDNDKARTASRERPARFNWMGDSLR